MFLMPVPAPAPTQLWKPPHFSLAFLIPPEPHTLTHADAYPDSLIPLHPTRYLPEGCNLSHKNNSKKSQAVNKRLKLLLKKEGCCCRYRSWGIARVPQCRSDVCPGVHRRTGGSSPGRPWASLPTGTPGAHGVQPPRWPGCPSLGRGAAAGMAMPLPPATAGSLLSPSQHSHPQPEGL